MAALPPGKPGKTELVGADGDMRGLRCQGAGGQGRRVGHGTKAEKTQCTENALAGALRQALM